MHNVVQILLQSAEDAFLQVGVFVGAMLLFFGYLNYKYAGGLIRTIQKYKRLQVIFGAILGASPGCGGAIFVMPLFLRGTVTSGTAVATLISTMGDSSFVIISRMPEQALYIHAISFVVGIACGYLVDALRLGHGLAEARRASARRTKAPSVARSPHVGHEAGDNVGRALHSRVREVPGGLGYEVTHRGYLFWWVICGIGFVLGVLILMQQDSNLWVGFNLTRIVGLFGAGLSVVWLIASHHTIADDTHAELEEKLASLKEMLIHNAHETSFVTFWVFVAYSAYALFMHWSQLDLRAIVDQAGVWSIIATACVGLIPGCGPQILTVTLYTKGVIPFSALVAHTLSQDGDALFPVLAMSPRAALWLTIMTTVPAVAIGVVFYLMGL